MSTAIVRCPGCGTKNRVDRSRAATTVPRCARCREVLEIPAPQSTPLEVDDGTVGRVVEQSPIPVLLEFWSPYCLHCQKMEPVIRGMTPEASLSLRVARVNLEENRATAAHYGVTATPTLLVLDRGREIDRIEGAQTEDQLRYRLYRHLHP